MASMMAPETMIAGVELGGTKCIATLARGKDILRQQRWATEGPETLDRVSATLAGWQDEVPFEAIGIGSFGPLCLDPGNAHFGRIENTPKPGWAGADVHGHFARRFALPVGIDTDVGGAALAEGQWGAAMGCAVHGYATIGTGVGLGLVVDGKAVHGRLHPEAGHMRIRRTPGDMFAGACPAHGDCLEGLVGGPALAARANGALADMPDDDPLWDRVARELGEWVAMLILCVSPQRLVIGGGVLDFRPTLLAKIQVAVAANLGGYLAGLDLAALETLIVPPALGRDAGPLGAIVVGHNALMESQA